jgi:hypothetical protein
MGTNILVHGDGAINKVIANKQERRVTYQVSEADDARTEFIRTGQLPNHVDAHYRSINDLTPVFAFSHHVGDVSNYNSSQE